MSRRTIYIDVDNTLIQDVLSASADTLLIEGERGPVCVKANEALIDQIHGWYNRGFELILWSGSGGEWARSVAVTLGIEEAFSAFLSKPSCFVDDLPPSEWIGHHMLPPAFQSKKAAGYTTVVEFTDEGRS